MGALCNVAIRLSVCLSHARSSTLVRGDRRVTRGVCAADLRHFARNVPVELPSARAYRFAAMRAILWWMIL